jgi:hypothetical protein
LTHSFNQQKKKKKKSSTVVTVHENNIFLFLCHQTFSHCPLLIKKVLRWKDVKIKKRKKSRDLTLK